MKPYFVEYSDKKTKIYLSEPETNLDILRKKIDKKVQFYYEFLDKDNDLIDKEDEKEIKLSAILIEDKIKIQPYVLIFDEDDKNIYKTIKENEKLSELRKKIKLKEEFVFLNINMEQIEEKDEKVLKIKDIMDEDDRKIIINKKYLFNIKLDDSNIAKKYEKNVKLSRIREELKTDLKNYVFLDKFKNKLTKSSESEVKIEDICDENNYIFTVQEFGKCLSICLGRDRSEDNAEIKSNLINRTKIDKNELISFLNDEPFDKKLINSIKTKEVDLSYILFNDLEQNVVIVEKNVKNPQVEAYRDGIFENYSYKILVIILYLGGNENKDKSISEENFKSNAGNMLEKKGFEYTIVYNYIDAIDELTQAEDGNCKYIQAWIFCSDGSGNTPCGNHKIYRNKDNCYEDGVNKIITKEDNEKYIVPFLETVSDFNKKGGSLLLFCDNEPFVLETNLLLTKYLKFQGNNIKKKEVQISKWVGIISMKVLKKKVS